MLRYLIVIRLISLSFTEFWNEDERTSKKAIYCCDDDVRTYDQKSINLSWKHTRVRLCLRSRPRLRLHFGVKTHWVRHDLSLM